MMTIIIPIKKKKNDDNNHLDSQCFKRLKSILRRFAPIEAKRKPRSGTRRKPQLKNNYEKRKKISKV